MITGQVTANREAVIELEIVSQNQKIERVEAVIDTGFNGYLTLPSDLVNRLNLQLAGNRRATLGDGNTVVMDVYLAKVIWHGQEREVIVLQAEGGPLIGMSLLYGNRVILTIVNGGDVTIDPIL
ncbi:MAG: clan AA aspartic protease [Candidatus Latescibacteria bacterium]|nr:clan AA aspartic protease [Candidatus Latescibacterota bacterium]